MAISIPQQISLNRRDYSIGQAIELDEGDLPATKDHPLVVLAFKYIAAPVHSVYGQIEDHFITYLDSSLMERIAEDDVDFDFDKSEYDRHLTSLKEYMEKLTLKSLIKKLKKYVGKDNQKWLGANIRSTEKEGLETLISEFGDIKGREKALSFNTRGEVASKINQAIKRDIPYYPILEYFTDRGHNSDKTPKNENINIELEEIEDAIVFKHVRTDRYLISLTDRKTKIPIMAEFYSLTINMGKVFDKLLIEQDIKPIPQNVKRLPSFKKAYKKFTFHPDNTLGSPRIEEAINAIYEFNEILASKVFDTDVDGIELTEEKRKMAFQEGEFDEELKILDKLLQLNMITNEVYNDFKEGKRFTSFKIDEGWKNFILNNINFKANLKENKNKAPKDYCNEIEMLFQKQKAKKKQKKAIDDAKIQETKIISAPPNSTYSERNLFMNESWKTPENVKLNFDALKYNRKLYEAFKSILIPSDSSLMIDLLITPKLGQQTNLLLTQADSEEWNNKWINVVRLIDYTTTSKKYYANTLREIRPSYITNTRALEDTSQKRKMPSKQGIVEVSGTDDEGEDKSGKVIAAEKARGVVEAGLPRTNYSQDLNAFMYYIMRQTNKLERYLGGQIIKE
jgi:hypothetical protein